MCWHDEVNVGERLLTLLHMHSYAPKKINLEQTISEPRQIRLC